MSVLMYSSYILLVKFVFTSRTVQSDRETCLHLTNRIIPVRTQGLEVMLCGPVKTKWQPFFGIGFYSDPLAP